jgi:hypothetical protein
LTPLKAEQAESEVKKLLFSVSEKKSRRARLVANELPPNPVELDKSLIANSKICQSLR